MRSILWLLGLIFGTLSVVMLIKHGFEVNFVSSLQVVLDYYEQAMQLLLGWAELLIKQELAALRDWLGWELSLYPHWKHVFSLVALYFGADIRNAWTAPYSPKSYLEITLRAWCGLVIAIVVSLIAGSMSLDSPNAMVLPASVMIGFVAYEILGSILSGTLNPAWGGPNFGRAKVFFAIGATILLGLGLLERGGVAVPNLSFFALVVFVVVVAGYRVLHGVRFAFKTWEGRTWLSAFTSDLSARAGVLMFMVILGAITFLATNAGLKFAGL